MPNYSQQMIWCCLKGNIRILSRVKKLLLQIDFGFVATKGQFQLSALGVGSSYLYKSCKGRIQPWPIYRFLFQGKVWLFKILFVIYTSLNNKKNNVLLILENAVRTNLDKFKSHYCQMWLELVCCTKCYVISCPGKKLLLESQRFC